MSKNIYDKIEQALKAGHLVVARVEPNKYSSLCSRVRLLRRRNYTFYYDTRKDATICCFRQSTVRKTVDAMARWDADAGLNIVQIEIIKD